MGLPKPETLIKQNKCSLPIKNVDNMYLDLNSAGRLKPNLV